MEKNFKPRGKRKKKKIPKKYFLLIIPILILALLASEGRKLTFREIEADQVAVIINNITGNIKTIDRAGAVIYYPFIQDLYILDKKEQSAPMMSANISADYPEGNPVILKTRDGGDVSLDLVIQYRLISKMAGKVVQDTGIGDLFKEKWIYDYAKTICRYEFGELTIQEFPDAVKRDEKTKEAKRILNELLNPFGIFLTSLNFVNYRYYREYAEKILERRLADKEVEEQRRRGKAAEKNQERVKAEETKKLEVAVAGFRGELSKMEIDATAKAEQITQAGIAYLLKANLDADAEYDRLKNEAAAILAVREAQAAGILALRRALEGEGGRNLVAFEYAKRLRKATIKGTPVWTSEYEIPQLRIREKETIVRSVEAMPPRAEERKPPAEKGRPPVED